MIYDLKNTPFVTLGQCSSQCQGCPGLQGCPFASQGLGAISLPGLGEIDWKLILAAAGVWGLGWLVMRHPDDDKVRRRRQRQLVRARARYQLAQL